MTYITQLTWKSSGFGSRIMAMGLVVLGIIATQSRPVHAQWTTSGNNINNTNTGNVGIGSAVPAYKLDVQANAQWVARFKKTDTTNGGIIVDAAAGYNPNLALSVNGTIKWYMNSNTTNGDALQFWETSGGYPRFTLTQVGNVGIGTITPLGRLDVRQVGGLGYATLLTSYGATEDTYLRGGTSSAVVHIGDVASTTSKLLLMENGGNVGIGNTNPQSTVQIGPQTPSGSTNPARLSLGGTYSTAAGNNLKLRLYDDGVAANIYGFGVSPASMDFGVGVTAAYNWYSGGSHKMTLSSDGNLGIGTGAVAPSVKLHVAGDVTISGTGNLTASGTITGGTINAKYQDVAEWVESSQTLAAGTVVVLDHTRSNQVIASSKAYDTRVAGVISLQPGITLGENGAGKVLVATTGRVKIKVDATAGPIQIGDLLVTSDKSGVAKKSEPLSLGGVQIHRPGTLIGKALEPLANGTGEILVLLSLQ